MRVLVTWGSERGGTEGIARILAQALQRDGIDVVALPPHEIGGLDGIDAVIVGGALYANRWHRSARRFVRRHVKELRRVPVWFFSSGPLDDSAERGDIAPPGQVAALMTRVGARGHITFGGRLEKDARGFPARAMAKKLSGDWRNPAKIRAWADELADILPSARPGHAVEPPARSVPRLVAYAVLLAVIVGAARLVMVGQGASGLMLAFHAVTAAVVAGVLARAYFLPRGAREPLPTAVVFATTAAALDAIVLRRSLAEPLGIASAVTSALLILLTVWAAGGIASTLPWPKPETLRRPA